MRQLFDIFPITHLLADFIIYFILNNLRLSYDRD